MANVAWWKEHLDGLATLLLPTDYPRPRISKYVDGRVQLTLTDESVKQLEAIGSATSATPLTVLLALFSVLLHKHTKEEDIIIGTAAAGGNALPLRLNVVDDETFAAVVQKVSAESRAALEHELPFAELVAAVSPPSEEEPGPFCQVCFFDAHNSNASTLAAVGACDWRAFVQKDGGNLSLAIQYNQALFKQERMTDVLAQMQGNIVQVSKNTNIQVVDISSQTDYARSVCPDPLSKLDDTWRGSIQSIFAKNAEAHPDRVLAVSSKGTYTYDQVHKLSNKLANYLIQESKIQKEERVAIYAHRSCPLVVAMMGILKAGATITIVDPAYPSARQIVYFEVAEPRALVQIKEAGALPKETAEFVKNTPTIRTVLEGLDMEMLEEGKAGGLTGYSDVDPKVEVSCHNICTLSFTSGTTGIPKGVMGRHISLTHFYPWMGQEFGIGENDRFTMLSGIAHDPIQRDVFTPLFFGAQIRIPDQDDIINPGALAQWCADNEVTVTHLTPAMGQILTANATAQIPSFKNAFFVGDVLVKRDVLRLREITPNLNIINMYGTTETQRSVSYLSVKPDYPLDTEKEILPAGRGMQDVQLLVLNGKMQIAGIGEAGEIFVRSYHLAKGYLGLDDSTKEKFIQNPFNPSDPYDRMYRSGDVGRYLPNGIVECAGRADDQVKIRGFRVELREIDTYMTQHPKVREAVTLLRRDNPEEPRLVAYFVTEDEDYTIVSIRDHLKSKLPSYAIPQDFVPLARMPLNPNGKIDKNKLLPPSKSAAEAEASAPPEDMTNLQAQLHGIWAQILKTTSFNLDDNFFDIGGHSVLATSLIFNMRQALKTEFPLNFLFENPTIRKLAECIEGDAEPAAKRQKVEEAPVLDLKAELKTIADSATAQAVFAAGKAKGKKFKPVTAKQVKGVFLTGATGFLGAFLVAEFMQKCPKAVVHCLTRAPSQAEAQARLKKNLLAHGLTAEAEAEDRYVAVLGDLAKPALGMTQEKFAEVADAVDIIMHNGAMVHWVYPFSKLKAPNVDSTMECLRMATSGKALKTFHFVSSTSVLDTDHYVKMDKVFETDNLDGAATGLGAGYGQSKWVSERLIMQAQAAGVPATIIRPGYIVGHSKTGVTNSDDFLWRLMKGCIELGYSPKIANRVNMCPVDYVAGASVAIATKPGSLGKAFHMVNPSPFLFTDYFAQLSIYGFDVKAVEYPEWREKLLKFTMGNSDCALFPVLHIVLEDLPTGTKGPLLDAANTVAACKGTQVKCPAIPDVIGLYFAHLTKAGFLPPIPEGAKPEKEMPVIEGEAHMITRSGN